MTLHGIYHTDVIKVEEEVARIRVAQSVPLLGHLLLMLYFAWLLMVQY